MRKSELIITIAQERCVDSKHCTVFFS